MEACQHPAASDQCQLMSGKYSKNEMKTNGQSSAVRTNILTRKLGLIPQGKDGRHLKPFFHRRVLSFAIKKSGQNKKE